MRAAVHFEQLLAEVDGGVVLLPVVLVGEPLRAEPALEVLILLAGMLCGGVDLDGEAEKKEIIILLDLQIMQSWASIRF